MRREANAQLRRVGQRPAPDDPSGAGRFGLVLFVCGGAVQGRYRHVQQPKVDAQLGSVVDQVAMLQLFGQHNLA